MNEPFQYPKVRHARSQNPRQYKNYGSYKRYLRVEFQRTCVYCRQPDSSAPNLTFGADHYRPKGLSKFAHLVADYQNLLYCCNTCNSYKNNYWPDDENTDPFVVNPCDHIMADHLRFDKKTGKVFSLSPNGKWTLELLHLDDEKLSQYRQATVYQIGMATHKASELNADMKKLSKLKSSGGISQEDYDSDKQEIEHALEMIRRFLEYQLGTEPPIPRPRSKRFP